MQNLISNTFCINIFFVKFTVFYKKVKKRGNTLFWGGVPPQKLKILLGNQVYRIQHTCIMFSHLVASNKLYISEMRPFPPFTIISFLHFLPSPPLLSSTSFFPLLIIYLLKSRMFHSTISILCNFNEELVVSELWMKT